MAENKYDLTGVDDILKKDIHDIPVEQSTTSPLYSFVSGLEKTATFGFGDEAAGALETLGRLIGVEGAGAPHISEMDIGSPLSWEEAVKAGEEAKERYRGKQKITAEEHPVSNIAGELVGALTTPTSIITPAKGAGFLQRGLASAGEGLISGAAQSLGTAEDLSEKSIKNVGTDATTSAVLNTALTAVLPSGAKKLDTLGEKFKYYKHLKNVFGKAKEGESLWRDEVPDALRKEMRDIAEETLSEAETTARKVGKKYDPLKEQLEEKIAAPMDAVYSVKQMRPHSPGVEASKDINKVDNILDSLVPFNLDKTTGEVTDTGIIQSVGRVRSTIKELDGIIYNPNISPTAKEYAFKAKNRLEESITEAMSKPEYAKYAKDLDKLNKEYVEAKTIGTKLVGLGDNLTQSWGDRAVREQMVRNLDQKIEQFIEKGSGARQDILQSLDLLKKFNPQRAAELENKMSEISMDMYGSKALRGESTLGHSSIVSQLLNIGPKATSSIAADVAGRAAFGVKSGIDKSKKILEEGYNRLYGASPETLQNVADQLSQRASPYAEKLKTIITSPDKKRKAMLFTLMQDHGFREAMREFVPDED
jgi:hypothetical protein